MYEIENSVALFSSVIKINYDRRFIRTAQNFIESLSGVAGASTKEGIELSLLIEECLAFIIDKYIDCRMAAHIELCFTVTPDRKVCIEITDIGPPIHEDMIPSFDIADENSDAGLWYKVVRGLSDDFAFVNRLKAGWLIRIEKGIEKLAFKEGAELGEESGSCREESRSGEKRFRRATESDIPALIDLAYMTYRYTYDKDFYDRVTLKQHLEDELYEIMVAEHGNRVIGAYAVKYPDIARVFAELGSAMLSPEYRRDASALRLLMREMNDYVKANPHHCEFFMSTQVTSHARAQKILSRIHNGFKPLMIYLNRLPGAQFVGIANRTEGRESLVYVYHLNDRLKTGKIYAAAPRHVDMIKELVSQAGNDVDVAAEFAEPETAESHISVKRVDFHQSSDIQIEVIGRDWFMALSKRIFGEIVSGIETVSVLIPASRPLPADMEGMLNNLNLVFCGLSLTSLKQINLTYCLSIKPVDFERIQLHYPMAQKLLAHIKEDYRRPLGDRRTGGA